MRPAIHGFKDDPCLRLGKAADLSGIIGDERRRNQDPELMDGRELARFLAVELVRLPGVDPARRTGVDEGVQRTHGIVAGDALLLGVRQRHSAHAGQGPPENTVNVLQGQRASTWQEEGAMGGLQIPGQAEVARKQARIEIRDGRACLRQRGVEMRRVRIRSVAENENVHQCSPL
jgi:hypothetical protein